MRKKIFKVLCFVACALLVSSVFISGCAPPEPKNVKFAEVPRGGYEPSTWGKIYPEEYRLWTKTKEQSPAGKSKYKPGWDTDNVIYDKLSEFPYMALLFNGWGFGVEYNEPRGHYYMLSDQLEIDPSRVKAGGACLSCKTPYAGELKEKYGADYYKMPYLEAVDKIPVQHRTLGVTCIDCHDPKYLELKIARWTLEAGLEELGRKKYSRQEMRSLVCAQCHVTYYVTKDADMKSTGVFFPWQGSRWSNISVENIIKVLKSDPSYLEWKQSVTGFKLAFIRHPEFEFYTYGSVHWKAGVSCADCHMPYTTENGFKVTDHDIMSPLKNDLKACRFCHIETVEQLKEQVVTIQDRTVSLMQEAGYGTAVVAKLFELTHREQAEGTEIDQALYDKAKDLYLESFYRSLFLGAENSVGFHNPSEAGRIAGDAISYAGKAEGLLRQMLTQAGVDVPVEIDLELEKYTNNRGEKKLMFQPGQEFKDPYALPGR